MTDVFIAVCDGLTTPPNSGNTVLSPDDHAGHLIRATLRYTSDKHWEKLVRDLKPIYQAVNVAAAEAALDALEAKRYPAMIRLWRNA